jgi:hypothetical protein
MPPRWPVLSVMTSSRQLQLGRTTRGEFVSSMEEVEAAEAKMNAAKDALLSYIEGRQAIEREPHRRLVAQLKKAQANFLEAISRLGE